ncbi:hypothetical protein CRG98_000865 [Punica granatum]|uniref:Uncharacterized protein n=1 Tax=Punica granatum TaxID=22663 RepID=A0A2I0LDQ8_PUNGR|nr:hypothetical protein CRG98_000865 [Punica granatum]
MSSESSFFSSTLPSSLPTVPIKLNGTNYYFWKSVMTPLLRAYQLLSYADGSISVPPATITKTVDGAETTVENPDFVLWQTRDQFALTCIMLAVNQDVGANLFGVKTAAQAWTTLSTLFDSQTVAQEDLLDQQWRELNKGDSSMIEYLKNIKQLASRFSLLGKPLTSQQVNRRITSGLGVDWEPLVLALAPNLASMQIEELSALLLNQEARRQFQAASSTQSQAPPLSGLLDSPSAPPSASANIAFGRGRGRGRGSYSNGKNFAGKGKGKNFAGPVSSRSNHAAAGILGPNPQHFNSTAGSVHFSPSQSSSTHSVVACQLCQKLGHSALQCRLLPRSFQPATSSATALLTHGNTSSVHDLDWYVDSGATHHVTSDLGNIQFHENRSTPEQLLIGDGSGSQYTSGAPEGTA